MKALANIPRPDVLDLGEKDLKGLDVDQLRELSWSISAIRHTINQQGRRIQKHLGERVAERRAASIWNQLSDEEKSSLSQVVSDAGGIETKEAVNGE